MTGTPLDWWGLGLIVGAMLLIVLSDYLAERHHHRKD